MGHLVYNQRSYDFFLNQQYKCITSALLVLRLANAYTYVVWVATSLVWRRCTTTWTPGTCTRWFSCFSTPPIWWYNNTNHLMWVHLPNQNYEEIKLLILSRTYDFFCIKNQLKVVPGHCSDFSINSNRGIEFKKFKAQLE